MVTVAQLATRIAEQAREIARLNAEALDRAGRLCKEEGMRKAAEAKVAELSAGDLRERQWRAEAAKKMAQQQRDIAELSAAVESVQDSLNAEVDVRMEAEARCAELEQLLAAEREAMRGLCEAIRAIPTTIDAARKAEELERATFHRGEV